MDDSVVTSEMSGLSEPTEKKHPCPSCSRLFTCPHNVQQHIREKHSARDQNKCPDCSKAFPRPFSLYRHQYNVHGVDVRPGRGNTIHKPARRSRRGRTLGDGPNIANVGKGSVVEVQQPLPEPTDFQARAGTFSACEEAKDSNSEQTPSSEPSTQDQDTITCGLCGDYQGTADDIIYHVHIQHNANTSPWCPCVMCSIMYRDGRDSVFPSDNKPSQFDIVALAMTYTSALASGSPEEVTLSNETNFHHDNDGFGCFQPWSEDEATCKAESEVEAGSEDGMWLCAPNNADLPPTCFDDEPRCDPDDYRQWINFDPESSAEESMDCTTDGADEIGSPW